MSAAPASKSDNQFGVCFTFRDAHQSNGGARPAVSKEYLEENPNPSVEEYSREAAREYLKTFANIGNYGDGFKTGKHTAQTTGGMFFGALVKAGVHPFHYNDELCSTVKEQGVRQSMLVRGEHVFSVGGRQTYDVIKPTLMNFARYGMNDATNFNAQNDIRLMRGIPMAAREIREETGLDFKVQGAISIQSDKENGGVHISDQEMKRRINEIYLPFAAELISTGHEGLYVKNANGLFVPDHMQMLVEALNDEFEQHIQVHTHNTYGQGYATLMAAIRGGAHRVDVTPLAQGEGTGQPELGKLIYAIHQSGDQSLIERIPQDIEFNEIEKDHGAARLYRARFNNTEMQFNRNTIEVMKGPGTAGGAVAALKGMESVRVPLEGALKTTEWNTIRDAVENQATKVKEALGFPVNVTPNQAMIHLQAAMDVNFGGTCEQLHPMTIAYLTGQWGKVPEGVNKEIQQTAFQMVGIEQEVDIVPIEEMGNGLPTTKKYLEETSEIPETTVDEQIIASMQTNGRYPDSSCIQKFRDNSFAPPVMDDLSNLIEKNESLKSVAPQIIDIAYLTLECHKLEEGFYDGIEDTAPLISMYQDMINDQLDSISKTFKEDLGLSKRPLWKALRSANDAIAENVNALCGERISVTMPKFELEGPPKTREELLEVIEPHHVHMAVGFIADGNEDLLSSVFSKVRQNIQIAELPFVQALQAQDIFNDKIAEGLADWKKQTGLELAGVPEFRVSSNEGNIETVDNEVPAGLAQEL
tara:strand:+ start:483 stop:2750 length:2268 start_codon:yes stop_codon:yes gene_type:complete